VDILEILIKRPWLKRQYGDREIVSENIYRSIALEKPTVLMINESSFSNAEIMAEGFRRLSIGKIIGVETAGGVIGTSSYSLIDGSRMRLPSTGAYTVDGENLENNGRKPDIHVENHPEELDQGIDRQTEAAVKALLEQLGETTTPTSNGRSD
jgi:C-terminal processing protease CtpA/Prc